MTAHARKTLAVAAHFLRRELRNRYLGSLSGGLWALLQPLMQLAVYGFVWTYVFRMRLPGEGLSPAAIVPFLALGVWPWNAFAEAVMRSATAIQDNAGLIGKVAFPHGALVFAASSASFLLHGAGFLIVTLVIALLGIPVRIEFLPLGLLAFAVLFVLALGFGFLFAALQVFVRDLSHVLGQLLPMMMFASPVLYSRDFLPERFRPWLDWNPFTFYPEYLRAELLGIGSVSAGDVDAVPVLRGVNLEVVRGESLGLIGENGAGKSTLLKLLTGVLTPTTGHVEVRGRVGALLELGAGFHPEYTGRDNIAMSAALYGLTADELREKLAQIVAFADIGRYIDEPVKHYSSGMVVRLGFAIVAALRPDLLITDEVLAVGDESFQKKCVQWMEDYLAGGGTLILVSHSMYHIQKLCRHALWLREGGVAAFGEVFEVTQAYLAHHERKLAGMAERGAAAAHGVEFRLDGFAVNGLEQETPVFLDQGGTLRLTARVRSRDARAPTVAFGIARADGTAVYGVGSDMDGVTPYRDSADIWIAEIVFENLALLPGSYTVRAHPMDTEGVRLFDTLERAIVVRGNAREFGLVRLAHRWNPAPAMPQNGADSASPSRV